MAWLDGALAIADGSAEIRRLIALCAMLELRRTAQNDQLTALRVMPVRDNPMLFDGAIVAIIIALIAGGRFSRLAEIGFRWAWVFFAAFALRFGIVVMGVSGWRPALAAAPVLHLASYALLLAALVANRRLWPIWIAAVGVVMNFAVIAANGGAMPADRSLVRASGQVQALKLAEAGRYPTHRFIDSDTRLAFLADRYLLPRPYPRPSVFSPGDVLITLGVVLMIFQGMGAFGWRARESSAAKPSA